MRFSFSFSPALSLSLSISFFRRLVYSTSSEHRLFILYPKAIIRIAIVIANNIYCIPTYVIWMMLLLPIRRCHPDLYYKIEGLFFHWMLSIVAMWSWTAGYNRKYRWISFVSHIFHYFSIRTALWMPIAATHVNSGSPHYVRRTQCAWGHIMSHRFY